MIGFAIVGKIERWQTLSGGTHPVGHSAPARLSLCLSVPVSSHS